MIAEGLEIDMNIAINQIVVTRSSSSSFHASEIEHQFGPRRHDFRTAIKPGNTAKGKRRIRPSGIKPVQIVDSDRDPSPATLPAPVQYQSPDHPHPRAPRRGGPNLT